MTRERSEREKARARERAKEWYQDPANRAKAKARSAAWAKANPERQAEHQRNYRERNKAKLRETRIRSKYGMSAEAYQELMQHHGICDSCDDRPAEHIDHDHDTGAVRGYLCAGCNWAAGNLGDDPNRAIALAKYLKARRI